jgi:hypothetical protein
LLRFDIWTGRESGPLINGAKFEGNKGEIKWRMRTDVGMTAVLARSAETRNIAAITVETQTTRTLRKSVVIADIPAAEYSKER